jgi:formylglycine-generating enzyme required for sulfatase activity
MRRYAALIFVLMFVVLAGSASARSTSSNAVPYVYRLKIFDCASRPTARQQTGFRVHREAGIVTALHGVADCKTVNALSDDGEEIFNDLTIRQVDIERDIALLSSPQLDGEPSDGLTPSPLTAAEIMTAALQIVGYPLLLEKQDVDSIVGIRDIESLDDVIPNNEEPAAFRQRHSPDLKITVLNVQAQLLPGHPGAPLLDDENRLVGVGNGGLRDGTVERSWAIPWFAVELQSVGLDAVRSALDQLTAQNPSLALSFSSTYPSDFSVTVKRQTIVGSVTGINDEPVSGAEVTLRLADSYFIDITATGGQYRFDVPTDYLEKQPELAVKATGYEPFLMDIFDRLRATIALTAVDLPRPVDLEPGQYLRIVRPVGLPLQLEPQLDSQRVLLLSTRHTVQVIDGPTQEEERTWWQVKEVSTGQRGWIIPADAENVFVELLPLFYPGDFVLVLGTQRRPFYDAPGVGQPQAKPIEPTSVLKVLAGPQVVSGYLWYKLERDDGALGWLAAFGYGQAYLALELDASPTSTATPTITVIPSATPTPLLLTPPPTHTPTPPPAHTPMPTATPTAPPLTTSVASQPPTPPIPIEPMASETWTNTKDSAVYIWIPPGAFTMGAGDEDKLADDEEKPPHTVEVDGFWIMQTEVTNAQYKKCVEAKEQGDPTGCDQPKNDRWNEATYAEHPVTDVDWKQANTYAIWVGGRLPTEAEWEKACRGPDGHTYPWGDKLPTRELLNFANDEGTTSVGSYPDDASPYGVLDVAGNVWEWTADWYDDTYYANSPLSNPKGPERGEYRTVRGGAWTNDAKGVRCAYRNEATPDYKAAKGGFRVVRASPPGR